MTFSTVSLVQSQQPSTASRPAHSPSATYVEMVPGLLATVSATKGPASAAQLHVASPALPVSR